MTAVEWWDSVAGIQTQATAGCSQRVTSQKPLSCLIPPSLRLRCLLHTKQQRREAPLHGNNRCTFNFGLSIKRIMWLTENIEGIFDRRLEILLVCVSCQTKTAGTTPCMCHVLPENGYWSLGKALTQAPPLLLRLNMII